METFCVHAVGKGFLESSALVLKLLKKMMGKYNWTELMHTIVCNAEYLMLTTVTFVSTLNPATKKKKKKNTFKFNESYIVS